MKNMPRRKKTRTTSIDYALAAPLEGPRVSKATRKMQMLRRDVAAEAARIMATESQRNFRVAKQKAAARIGVNSRLALPSNREIETALRAYQDLYGGEERGATLVALREVALKVMRALENFSPRLVGQVLDGTADQFSRISLHVFSDPPENVLFHLNERGIKFRQEERRIRWHDGNTKRLQLLVTEADDHPIELILFELKDLRQAPPSPVDGQPQQRAPISEVECLLSEI